MSDTEPLTAEIDRLCERFGVRRELAEFAVTRAKREGFDLNELRAPSAEMYRVRARNRISLAARKMGFSFPQIGRVLNRDHSTIMKNLRRFANGGEG